MESLTFANQEARVIYLVTFCINLNLMLLDTPVGAGPYPFVSDTAKKAFISQLRAQCFLEQPDQSCPAWWVFSLFDAGLSLEQIVVETQPYWSNTPKIMPFYGTGFILGESNRSKESIIRALSTMILVYYTHYTSNADIIAAKSLTHINVGYWNEIPGHLSQYWIVLKRYAPEELWTDPIYKLHLETVFHPSRYETLEITLAHVLALWIIVPGLEGDYTPGHAEHKERIYYDLFEPILVERDAYIKSLPPLKSGPVRRIPKSGYIDHDQFSEVFKDLLADIGGQPALIRMGHYQNLAGAFHAAQNHFVNNPLPRFWKRHLKSLNRGSK